MYNSGRYYDVGIVGGGLAGLSASIVLAKAGYTVVLFEKETYPFHKVCGEYISLESWDFLTSLGLELDQFNVPLINTLFLTSPDGSHLTQKLPLGGFGISRFTIDHALVKIARQLNVVVLDDTRVLDVEFNEDRFSINSNKANVICKVCCGAFGKRSNLDIKWKRKFVQHKPNPLNNFIGVKYHAVLNHPVDTIHFIISEMDIVEFLHLKMANFVYAILQQLKIYRLPEMISGKWSVISYSRTILLKTHFRGPFFYTKTLSPFRK